MRIQRLDPDLTVREIPVVYFDTETNHTASPWLPTGRRMTEFAGIRVEPDGSSSEFEYVIRDVDLTHADPDAMEVNGYARYQADWSQVPNAVTEKWAASYLARALHGVQVAAINVGFDMDNVRALLHRYGATHGQEGDGLGDYEPFHYEERELGSRAALIVGGEAPWSSSQLVHALGLGNIDFGRKHSALPDARRHRAIDERVKALLADDVVKARLDVLLGRAA